MKGRVFVFLVGLVVGGATVIDAAFPGANGKIAFVTYRDRNWEIYAMNVDGTEQTNLTNNAGADSCPAWSPGGTQIAFSSGRTSGDKVYVMKADGSDVTLLTVAHGSCPAWSPDGKKILFSSTRDGNSEIYVMNADGTEQTNLTNHISNDSKPAWSPDGSRIAFVSYRDGRQKIWAMNADGTEPTKLTTEEWAGWPAWSPDSSRIVYGSGVGYSIGIYVMNADGTGATFLTEGSYPAWSPDGTQVVFARSPGEIYVVGTDGSGVTRLTFSPSSPPYINQGADWQPIPTLAVRIDVKPGSISNSINPSSHGVIPVAILTTTEFDASGVDASTCRFGPTGTEAAAEHWAWEDVDADGDIDLILQFPTQSSGLVCGATTAKLTGRTVANRSIQGVDSVRTVGCPCVSAPPGMTAWWPADGDARDIIGGLDGVLMGDAVTGSGLVGGAFVLDGDGDFVEVSDHPALNVGTGDFSIALWALFNARSDHEEILAEKWIQRFPDPEDPESEGSEGWTFAKIEDEHLLFAVSAVDSAEEDVNSRPLPIKPGTWGHFAATRKDGVITLFMDSRPVAQGFSSLNLDSATPLLLGHRADQDYPSFLDGRIDEVQFFKGTALTREQIRQIYQAGSSGVCKP